MQAVSFTSSRKSHGPNFFISSDLRNSPKFLCAAMNLKTIEDVYLCDWDPKWNKNWTISYCSLALGNPRKLAISSLVFPSAPYKRTEKAPKIFKGDTTTLVFGRACLYKMPVSLSVKLSIPFFNSYIKKAKYFR